MNINKNSWHYAIYRATYIVWNMSPPESTNLCQYVNRTFLLLPFLFVGALFMWLSFGMVSLAVLLFGRYPTSYMFAGDRIWTFEPYKGLQVGKLSIYPWMVILPIAIVYGNIMSLTHLYWGSHHFMNAGSWSFLLGEAMAIVMALFVFSSSLGGEWVKAKKQKVCPLINFTDTEK